VTHLTRQSGQAMVEFALILPVLLLILLGIIDGGRLVYAYNDIANAAREAGRTAIINQDAATIRAKAAQQATGLGLPTADPGDCPMMGGPTMTAAGTCTAFLTYDTSDICSPPRIGCNAVVSVKWQWRAIIPIVGDLIGPVPLVSTTTQVIESACPRADVPDPADCLDR
jgi:Flp pilus assembly protein TadG